MKQFISVGLLILTASSAAAQDSKLYSNPSLPSREVIVDWNRDKTAFQVEGRWDDLGLSAMMPYLGPNASRTFSLAIPQRAQSCRIRMYYENGPLWSTVDQYLKSHGIYAADNLFIPVIRFNQKLPGHFRSLDIQVQMPIKICGGDGIRVAHNESRQLTPVDHRRSCWTPLARRSCVRRWTLPA